MYVRPGGDSGRLSLLDRKDLDPARFSAAGYAENNPLVPNDSAQNRSLNRRVDIVVLPLAQQN
ncbi:MAG: hypothetical protein ACOC2H_05795 [Spirochaetota bacterium]